MLLKAKRKLHLFWFITIVLLLLNTTCFISKINKSFNQKNNDYNYNSLNDFSDFILFSDSPNIISSKSNNSILFNFEDNYTTKVSIETYNFTFDDYISDFNISINFDIDFNKGLLGDVFFNLLDVCNFSISDLLNDSSGKIIFSINNNDNINTTEVMTSFASFSGFYVNVSRKNNILDFTLSLQDNIIFSKLCECNITGLLKTIQLGCRVYPFFNNQINSMFYNINAEIEISSTTPPPTTTDTTTDTPTPTTTETPPPTPTSLLELIIEEPLILLSGFLGYLIIFVFIISFVIVRYKKN